MGQTALNITLIYISFNFFILIKTGSQRVHATNTVVRCTDYIQIESPELTNDYTGDIIRNCPPLWVVSGKDDGYVYAESATPKRPYRDLSTSGKYAIEYDRLCGVKLSCQHAR